MDIVVTGAGYAVYPPHSCSADGREVTVLNAILPLCRIPTKPGTTGNGEASTVQAPPLLGPRFRFMFDSEFPSSSRRSGTPECSA